MESYRSCSSSSRDVGRFHTLPSAGIASLAPSLLWGGAECCPARLFACRSGTLFSTA